MDSLSRIGDLRCRLHVTFINEMGLEEVGIDAGGLFKELWTTLAGVAFNPEYGFFKVGSPLVDRSPVSLPWDSDFRVDRFVALASSRLSS